MLAVLCAGSVAGPLTWDQNLLMPWPVVSV